MERDVEQRGCECRPAVGDGARRGLLKLDRLISVKDTRQAFARRVGRVARAEDLHGPEAVDLSALHLGEQVDPGPLYRRQFVQLTAVTLHTLPLEPLTGLGAVRRRRR